MKNVILAELPYGSLVLYRKRLYFKSRGVDADILTNTDGVWFFIHELKWKSFRVIFRPNQRIKHEKC